MTYVATKYWPKMFLNLIIIFLFKPVDDKQVQIVQYIRVPSEL